MEKFPVGLALLVAAICQAHSLTYDTMPQHHHKVRHKHNFVQIDGRHVNEIREAFDDYKNAVLKPKVSKVKFDDVIQVKPLRYHRTDNGKLNDGLTQTATTNRIMNGETSIADPRGHLMTRYKRVHAAETTTHKASVNFSDNYDEEYDDEDEKTSRKPSNVSGMKVQETETAAQTLTDFKLEKLGTRSSVRQSFELELQLHNQRRNQQETSSNYDQATILKSIRENVMRTKLEGMCRWPNKKIIEAPHQASKVYSPRKYVIYKCSDETACCGSPEKTCVAKREEQLVLWFHVRYVGSTGYESLKVQNHTECECVYRNRQITSQSRNVEGASRVSQALPRTTTSRPARPQHCKCPSHFDTEVDEGHCGCVCRDGKAECRQRYEGKEGFTISDQRCITRKECDQPHCLYGSYVSSSGRCPNRNDKLRRGFHHRPRRDVLWNQLMI